MSKIDQLRDTYIKDVDLMSSKSRFGYFSILPNHSAGINTYQQKKTIKGQNGKVKTQQRNIFSGLTASGVLKKSYFNYQGSVFQGDPYVDTGKNERRQKMLEQKKLIDKEIYKPLSLTKTPDPKAAYEHVAQNPKKKLVKDYVDSNGKVRTEQRNIVSNSASNIQKHRLKQFKYIPDPYQYYRIVEKNELRKSITQRGEAPFKLSSQSRGQFSSNRQTYGINQKYRVNLEERGEKKQKLNMNVEHEGNFKPSCSKKYDTFSYPEYAPGGQNQIKKVKEEKNKQKQSFKLFAPQKNSKPCPSIAGLKTNILRCIR